uniref:Uncharacterized protein n=1 Tax=Rhizophora mucronata TaxID=61149 RepID=A0A2P2QVQ3_RHIMU
MLAPCYFLLLL